MLDVMLMVKGQFYRYINFDLQRGSTEVLRVGTWNEVECC